MMIHVESAIQQLLRNDGDIVALVGQRIHVGHRKQFDELPSLCVSKVESGDDHTICLDEDHRTPQILVEVFAADYFAANNLAELVRRIEEHTGIVTVKKPDGTELGKLELSAVIEDEDLDSPPPVDGSDNWTERRALLFGVICDRYFT